MNLPSCAAGLPHLKLQSIYVRLVASVFRKVARCCLIFLEWRCLCTMQPVGFADIPSCSNLFLLLYFNQPSSRGSTGHTPARGATPPVPRIAVLRKKKRSSLNTVDHVLSPTFDSPLPHPRRVRILPTLLIRPLYLRVAQGFRPVPPQIRSSDTKESLTRRTTIPDSRGC